MRCDRLQADDNLENDVANWPQPDRLPVERPVGMSSRICSDDFQPAS